MKFLGNISHLANSGKLIAKSSQTPPAGAFVFTNDKQKIGKVYNIFGPVKNPYISINLYRSVNKRDLESRQGEKLFVSTKREMEKDKKKKRSNKSKKGKYSKGKNKSKPSKKKRSNKKSRR
ncbi:H/ACA RNA-protein complex component Gar1 [Methanobrevibacter ruminantium M1]|uniref:H/ACA RNA-protein complex component Gar1 n=1 Tax=Methanobrevibacter ruminantium (strain ATCC 35063 / DSM 1093 / JCM 13430 / OCM 146 / M1) TaxID=634498 RepID=D3E203_METRM|nr:Gar1/Naf1 family protein [Methanobrevibacter ruminantium]ADC46564.1 H/ACA RNA-protein complex component Gar1 [Methanobrevibacter ruminantium M1]